jgi:hypothetical protein
MAILSLITFQQLTGLVKGQRGSVNDELVVAGVIRDLDHTLDCVSTLRKGLNDQIRIHRHTAQPQTKGCGSRWSRESYGEVVLAA